jgi:hypothetical protein
MNQLERLQRMGQGEAIPAPLTMGVAGRETEGRRAFLPNKPILIGSMGKPASPEKDSGVSRNSRQDQTK